MQNKILILEYYFAHYYFSYFCQSKSSDVIYILKFIFNQI